jgi:hypothetical protein
MELAVKAPPNSHPFTHHKRLSLDNRLNYHKPLSLGNISSIGVGVAISLLDYHCEEISYGHFTLSDIEIDDVGDITLPNRVDNSSGGDYLSTADYLSDWEITDDVKTLAKVLSQLLEQCRNSQRKAQMQQFLNRTRANPPAVGTFAVKLAQIVQPEPLELHVKPRNQAVTIAIYVTAWAAVLAWGLALGFRIG